MLLVAISQGPRGYLSAQNNDWGLWLHDQITVLVHAVQIHGRGREYEEPAWLALRSNSASVETGGGAVKGSNPSSPTQPLLRVRRK